MVATKLSCIVLDTNVILDCYFASRPCSEVSIAAVDAALKHDVTLLYSASQAKDVFFLAGMLLKSAERKERAKSLPPLPDPSMRRVGQFSTTLIRMPLWWGRMNRTYGLRRNTAASTAISRATSSSPLLYVRMRIIS